MRRISIWLSLFIFFMSCSKSFLDINNTPNNPLSVPPSTLLPTTTVGMAFANSNDLNRATSALVQHTAGAANQVFDYDKYLLDGAFDNQWNLEIYNGAIENLQILIDNNATTNPVYSGIAKLEQAYVFSMATDLWGDVPYSEAGRGLKNEVPRFDKVEDIYLGNTNLGITGLFDLVKSGLADLDKTGVLKPTKDDIVYGGDVAKWKRMGNTLLLKLAIQISNIKPDVAKTMIASVLTGNNYINASSFDFEVPFGSNVGNQNPIHSFNNVNRSGDQLLSTRLLALSRSLNDTIRLSKFFTKPNGVFTAFENGSTATAPALATRSKYNTYLTGSSGEAPIRLLTYFQVNFILAESALILGTTGNPDSLYKAGIRASMAKVGMTITEIDNYFLTNPAVVTLSGTTEDKRKQIITQKYIAWIGNGIEAFNDYRRTGYPILALPLNAAGDNANVVPTRLPYAPAELSRNPKAPSPRPKTDVKLWWAK